MSAGNNGLDSAWEALYDGISEENKPLDLSPFEDVSDIAKEPQCNLAYSEEHIPMSQYEGQYILIPVKSGPSQRLVPIVRTPFFQENNASPR